DATKYKQCQAQSSVTAKGDCLVWQSTHPIVKQFADCVDRWNGVESVPALAQCLKGTVYFTAGGQDLVRALRWMGPAHAVSRTGFMKGNAVQYFTRNRQDQQIRSHFEDLYRGDSDPVAQDSSEQSVDQIFGILSSGKLPFEGPKFASTDENPVFQYNNSFGAQEGIFPEILRAIRGAKHTIFVDVFFIGGTMGADLAKELIKKADSGVKVFFLHDPWNGFGHNPEMDPVFHLLLAYSKQHPDRMTAAGSYLFAHRTGLPRYFDALLPDKLVNAIASHIKDLSPTALPLFPKAKSDHSKVMVIDGAGLWADAAPTAYVGSKNWTDSSGGMTFDEVAKVTGPAAVAVQDSYYWDFWYALTFGGVGRQPMNNGQIEAALSDFDPLARRWDAARGRSVPTRSALTNVAAQAQNTTVRLGENNVDGSVMGCLDQDVLAIRAAKKQIIINDQYLYDRRLVEELLEKARNSPDVRIYIMLEPVSEDSNATASPLGGFPNTLYADLLTYKELEVNRQGVVTKKVAWPNIQFRWKKIPKSDEFHIEYHMKTISVDGFDASGNRVAGAGPAVIISGSANKDHMTMHGAFREMQLEVWDNRGCTGSGIQAQCGAVAEADKVFWWRWNNQAGADEGEGSLAADPFKFQVTPQLQQVLHKLMGRDLTPPEFLMWARSLIHGAYELETNAAVE
ncbi:MAG TPA: phospholipase D-like domain-containing protein, partial [Bdellovibrionota bacterium]|nr:phospholipase D-like domain-containing protein [Bdellovibrionota bacterium]